MIIGVATESYPGEDRVALVPGVVANYVRAGFQVLLEGGAGARAGFPDQDYQEQGVKIASRDEVFSNADILPRVRGFETDIEPAVEDDLRRLRREQHIVGLLNPLGAPGSIQTLAKRGVTAYALELLPRIGRAQTMDALTAMASIGGYKAMLIAANNLPKMFPMMMTAAGTITPARVFVVGAGVAGLQAVATAKRLGAVVQAYDVRPVVKEQVESLGARFVELDLETAEGSGGYAREMDEEFYAKQREKMLEVVAESDVVVTTAAIPGRRSPILLTEEMVKAMPPGSVVVDMAVEGGGNCELTLPGETTRVHDVTIVGQFNLPSSVPYHASQMYARNLQAFLNNLVKEGEIRLNLEDPIIEGTLVTGGGEVTSQQVREQLGLPAKEGGNEG